jgi:GH25 family lysozyme M1 (1,4-beta-N-acetylmuramidase)
MAYDADYVEPNGHVLTEIKIDATCIMGGHTHFSCEICEYEGNRNFTEFDENNHVKSVSVSNNYPTIMQAEEPVNFTCLGCGRDYGVTYADIYSGAYVSNTEVLKRGIDTSKWNHVGYQPNGELNPLDWEALKTAGVEFVILKAGSTNGIDPTFEMDYAGAKAAGLEVGAYFYSYALTAQEALAEAELMLTWLEGKQFELPIYFDLENPTQENLDQSLLMEMCTAFIGRLQSAGYFAALYTNTAWLYGRLDTEWVKTNLDVWYARYTKDSTAENGSLPWTEEDIPWKDGFESSTVEPDKRYGVWQYTQIGQIDGFTGPFDLNYSFKDYKSLMEQWGLNGF